MFQIGRSSESAIDFIVLDTVIPSPNPSNQQQQNTPQQSTISRFSCRIVVERQFPYTARIYAAGFDSSKRIFLGEKASKWRNDKGELDGVTTNGVLIMHPSHGFTGEDDSKPGEWMEVSVCGAVFKLNESRISPNLTKNQALSKSTNILRDGTLIDLCGATLVWRSTESLQRTPTKHYLDMNLEHLNRIRPQCPVGLKTLVFPSSASPLNASQHIIQPQINLKENIMLKKLGDRVPMVYLKCGHVHGHHDWGVKKDNERECPLCRKVRQKFSLNYTGFLYF
jgi:pellino protein